jgi:hypothetical protein
MRGFKPNHAIWKRMNESVLGENVAVVMITMISGMLQMLIKAGVSSDEESARVSLAAMVLSPDTHPQPGALLPRLQAEIAKLGDGKRVI